MIMTQDKAKKTAVRRRMAETGEPYSVARRAVQAGQPGTGEMGQIFVRYRLARTFELEVDEETWAGADNQMRARLIAERTGQGSPDPGTTLAELIAHDLDERGAGAFAEVSGREWEEEYYADGAASEGITVEEFKAREASGQPQEWARERPQERADQAQERADQAQERAEQAQERADQAQEQADEALERADEARDVADEARHVSEDTGEDGDRAAWERAEREVARAQERADRAQARAEQEQERADREQERAEQEQERADREQERADDPGPMYHRAPPGTHRPPRPPRPRMPRMPRLPRLPG
jgi:Alanine-zipper, major outer membrane lipoprotein